MTKRVTTLLAALVVSGSCALIYQSTWGRMLQRVFGVSDLAVATVLAAFFLGLGLGAGLGGRWAPRVRSPALAYAALEALIGLWALASLWLIPHVHAIYAAVGGGASFEVLTVLRLGLALLILLPPTVAMGATMPILIDAMARARRDWSTPATTLYAANTFGAVLGAGAAGFWLLPAYGARASIVAAALGSFVAGGAVWLVWRRLPGREAATDVAPSAIAEGTNADPGRPRLAMVLAAMAGSAALAGEVVWTRVLRIVVQGTTQAFAAMLVNFLVGIALGSLIADRIARRGSPPARLFAWSQMLIAVLVAVAMWTTPQLPRWMGLLRGDPDLAPHETGVLLALSALLLLPLAIGIGASIPLAWRVAGGSGDEAARRAGRVLAANTIGGLIGSLATGFLLVPSLGVDPTLMTVIFLHVLATLVAFRASAPAGLGARVVGLTAPLALGVAVLLAAPSVDLPFLLHARTDPTRAIIEGPGPRWRKNVVFLREGRNTTVTVLRDGVLLRLYNDGRPESGFGPGEPGFGRELALLGSLPGLFADRRERALAIGLGGGHTTSVLMHGPWREIDVVELEQAVVDASRLLHQTRGKPFPLDDPRTHLVVDDARARMVLSPADRYDAIVSQPSHPWLAGSSALYTREFFGEARRALRSGGVMALWVNLFRIDVPHIRSVVRTLIDVFPYAHAFVVESSSFLLVASDRPIPLDQVVADRLAERDGVRTFLQPSGLGTLEQLVSAREMDTAALRTFAHGAPEIVDDRPSLEFDLGRMRNRSVVTIAELDRVTRSVPWISADALREIPRELRLPSILMRVDHVHARPAALQRVSVALRNIDLPVEERAVVEGALAEAHGRVTEALTKYDGSPLPTAAGRADALRHAERRDAEALQVAVDRRVVRPLGRPLLSSAAAVDTPEALAIALAAVGPADPADPGEAALRRTLEAFRSGGCDALAATGGNVRTAAADDEHVAFLAEQCAIHRGDLADARATAELRMRGRRAIAAAETQLGLEDAGGGNTGGAMMHLRRALAANPANAPAAATLARLLHRTGRRDRAAALLRETAQAARGLPRSMATLGAAAAELRVDLGIAPTEAGAASSTSTATTSTGDDGPAPE